MKDNQSSNDLLNKISELSYSANVEGIATNIIETAGVCKLITQYFNELQPQWVSVDNIKLNISLIVPALQYEGPDYYKGYHQAREDMLSTLPPSDELNHEG
jgi:hypothetical protein